MKSLRELFHLEPYSEKVVDKVVKLKTSYETSHMSNQEIAEAVNITPEDVDAILSETYQIWRH